MALRNTPRSHLKAWKCISKPGGTGAHDLVWVWIDALLNSLTGMTWFPSLVFGGRGNTCSIKEIHHHRKGHLPRVLLRILRGRVVGVKMALLHEPLRTTDTPDLRTRRSHDCTGQCIRELPRRDMRACMEGDEPSRIS